MDNSILKAETGRGGDDDVDLGRIAPRSLIVVVGPTSGGRATEADRRAVELAPTESKLLGRMSDDMSS